MLLLFMTSTVECDGKPCSNKQVDLWIECSIGRTVLPKNLCSCAAKSSNLTKLVIKGNKHLKRLPEGLPKNLTRLTKLEIKDNPDLTELPKGLLDNLTNLKVLDLQQNSLSVAPNVDHLKSLLKLTLAYNPISTLPGNYLKSNTHLTLFKATDMGLTEVPIDLFKTTTQMEYLHLDVNQITTLAEDIFQNLESLRSLNLADNFLSSLSVTIFKDLGSLLYLDLRRNNLSSDIVDTFSPIRSNLKELKLSSNRLRKFDLTQATNFPLITKLLLDQNQISVNIREDQLDFAQDVTLDLKSNARVRVILNEDFAKCDGDPRVTLQLSETDLVEDCFKTKLKDDLRKGRGRCIKLPGIEIPAESETWITTCPFPYGDLIPDKCTTGCNCSFNFISKESLVDCSDNGTITFDSDIPHVRNKTSSMQVVLSRNGITDIESIFGGVQLSTLNKIRKLDLSENEISRINASILPQNLRDLYLNNNALSGVTELEEVIGFRGVNLSTLNTIRLLDLSGNEISRVNASALPQNLRDLYLNNNALSEVNEEVIGFFKNSLKRGVKLGGNKFACTCRSMKLINFLKTTYSKVLDIDDISFDCYSSEPFNGEGSHTEDRVCPKLDRIALVTAVIFCFLLLCVVLIILRKKEMIWFRVSFKITNDLS